MLPIPRGPPPADGLQSIQIPSLEAALAKLNINVSIETLLKTIRDEEEARRVKLTAERRIALSKLALQPQPSQPTAGLEITTVSHFVPKPTKPANVDLLAKKRRRRLLELTKEAFPDGKVPDPFTLTWLGVSQDVAANKLPFILASRIVVTSAADLSENPPRSVFENVWCLWDTGAQISFIVTSQLDTAVRDNQTEGTALMDITFAHLTQTIGSIIHFRPRLPNGVTFIILGQHALLNRLEYRVQPVVMNPHISQHYPQAYGQIDLIAWADPASDEVQNFQFSI